MKEIKCLDLFAGCGAFGFALTGQARVHAVEGDRAIPTLPLRSLASISPHLVAGLA